jgi:hypothetical protein
MRFELSFEAALAFPYRRWHGSLEAAEAEVDRVYRILAMKCPPRYEVCDGDGRIVASTLIKAMKS